MSRVLHVHGGGYILWEHLISQVWETRCSVRAHARCKGHEWIVIHSYGTLNWRLEVIQIILDAWIHRTWSTQESDLFHCALILQKKMFEVNQARRHIAFWSVYAPNADTDHPIDRVAGIPQLARWWQWEVKCDKRYTSRCWSDDQPIQRFNWHNVDVAAGVDDVFVDVSTKSTMQTWQKQNILLPSTNVLLSFE